MDKYLEAANSIDNNVKTIKTLLWVIVVQVVLLAWMLI